MLKENLKKSEYVVVHLRGGDKPWKCEVCLGEVWGEGGFPSFLLGDVCWNFDKSWILKNCVLLRGYFSGKCGKILDSLSFPITMAPWISIVVIQICYFHRLCVLELPPHFGWMPGTFDLVLSTTLYEVSRISTEMANNEAVLRVSWLEFSRMNQLGGKTFW